MSTFYLLPPRPLLGERLANLMAPLFPGLELPASRWSELADSVGQTAADLADVYVVYLEELAEGQETSTALREGFGAEPGDEVVEVRPGGRQGELVSRRWRL